MDENKKKWLIGVDSDGTAFDSMNRKHIDAFIPAALEIWDFSGDAASAFDRIEREINLYEDTRGINRFPGLAMTFDRLRGEYPEKTPDTRELHVFLEGESRYSPASLRRWEGMHPSDELRKVLAWSDRADELFAEACADLPPFPGVLDALAKAHDMAYIAVISSATREGLEKDWTRAGLASHVDWIMSQEDGSKADQLRTAKARCGGEVCALMIGDTKQDELEARKVGADFYLITPGEEDSAWRRFQESILPGMRNSTK